MTRKLSRTLLVGLALIASIICTSAAETEQSRKVRNIITKKGLGRKHFSKDHAVHN